MLQMITTQLGLGFAALPVGNDYTVCQTLEDTVAYLKKYKIARFDNSFAITAASLNEAMGTSR
jgi:hypothetical protein